MTLLATHLAMAGGMPEIKITAKDKRDMKRVIKNTPPRSMTPEEVLYYKKHKNQ